MNNPYEEVLRLVSYGEKGEARERLESLDRSLDPLAYDEAAAEVRLSEDRNHEAAVLAEATLRSGRDTPRLHMIAAEAQTSLGLRAEARNHLQAVGENDARACYLAARIAYGEERFLEAERLARAAQGLFPDWPAPQSLGLAARMSQGDPDARIELVRRWRESGDRIVLEFLLHYLAKGAPSDLGDEIVVRVRTEGFEDSRTLSWTMWHDLKRGRVDEAIRSYEEAPEDLRDSTWALLQRGHASNQKRRYTEALPYLERAFALDPTNESVLDALAQTLLRLGRFRRFWKVMVEHRRETERQMPDGEPMRDFFENLRWHREERRRRSLRR